MSRSGRWLSLRPPARAGEIIAALREGGLFPEPGTWWFGWDALDIVLPGLLSEESEVDRGWEVVRVFSARAELRLARRGRATGCWLLLEEDPRRALGDHYEAWVQGGATDAFRVEEGHHLLAGVRLRLPGGEKRGEIIYPRPLEYGIEDDDLEQALVGDVRLYYDDAYRLVTARYAGIRLVPPGTIAVEAFPEPDRAVAH